MSCAGFYDSRSSFRPSGQRRYLIVAWIAPETLAAFEGRSLSRQQAGKFRGVH